MAAPSPPSFSSSWALEHALFSGIFFVSVIVLCVVALTWALTSYQFHSGIQEAGKRETRTGKEPLTIPYAVPWFGSSLGFLTEQGHFYDTMRRKLGRKISLCTMRLGPVRAYIISGPSNINAVFKLSRFLSSDKFEEQVLIGFGMPPEEVKNLQEPERADKGNSLSDMGKRNRKYGLDGLWQEFLLSPEAVAYLTSKFLGVLDKALDSAPELSSWKGSKNGGGADGAATGGDDGSEWVNVDLGHFIKHHMFTASTTALFGTRYLELNPNLAKDFWEFDSIFLKLAYGIPRLLAWEAHAVRDRLLMSTYKWLQDADENGDISSELTWEPFFGSRLIRGRQRLYKSAGLTVKARAANECGMLFGLSSNAIPGTCWMLFHILTATDDLLPRVLAEVRSTIPVNAGDGNLANQIHIPTLIALPLLQSIYTETLRMYVAVNISREIKSDIEVDGHLLRAGNVMMAPTWIGHRDPDTWAAPGHPPPSEFFAERFLTTSGDEKDPSSKPPIFSISGMGGRYFPYGGGAHICPGRFFAKQEIMAAVALVLLRFEFQPEGWVDPARPNGSEMEQLGKGARGAKVKTGYVGNGVMAADRDLRVKMRKRLLSTRSKLANGVGE